MSKWEDRTTVVYIHNGILCSRNKGTPTLCHNMDGTGEHYAKWNKQGNERQIPYDRTYKWNIINKTNKQAKYNQSHWSKSQTGNKQRGGGKVITGKEGEGSLGTCIKPISRPMDKTKAG